MEIDSAPVPLGHSSTPHGISLDLSGDGAAPQLLPSRTRSERLRAAVQADDKKEVLSLLASGADLNQADPYGTTALMLAASAGNEDIAEELLERGAAVHAKDRYGQTALHYACAAGSYPVVALLLARRAGVNVATQHGQTALMKAAYVSHHHAAMIADLLLSHRARPDAQTPVVAPAAASAAPATSKAGNADTSAVVAVGGASAASIAVQNDHMEILHVLAHYGANMNIADGAGNTLLHHAAARGSFAMIGTLRREWGVFAGLAESSGDVLGVWKLSFVLPALTRVSLHCHCCCCCVFSLFSQRTWCPWAPIPRSRTPRDRR